MRTISRGFAVLVLTLPFAPARAEVPCDYGPSYVGARWLCAEGPHAGTPCVTFPFDPVTCGWEGDPWVGQCELEDTGARATYYDAHQLNACGYDSIAPDDILIAAVSEPDWQDGAMCGRCIEVTGPSGQIVARVVDRCPPESCPIPGWLDLDDEAFALVADPFIGRVGVDWETVPCDDVANIKVTFRESCSSFWYRVVPEDFRHGVAGVSLRGSGSEVWLDGTRLLGGFEFLPAGGQLTSPLDVRVVDIFGARVEAQDVDTLCPSASVADLGAQFPECPTPLFSDDFETGDLQRWSAVQP